MPMRRRAREQRLLEIRARLAQASPGPWEVSPRATPYGSVDAITDSDEQIVVTSWCSVNDDGSCDEGLAGRFDDISFCAASREDVPFLLEEIERLAAERNEAQNAVAAVIRRAEHNMEALRKLAAGLFHEAFEYLKPPPAGHQQ